MAPLVGRLPAPHLEGVVFERRIFREIVCSPRDLKQYVDVPVKYEAEKVYSSLGSALANACGLLNRNGVFYVSLKMQGQESPMEVALHGVRSEIEARLALATLSTLRGAECNVAAP